MSLFHTIGESHDHFDNHDPGAPGELFRSSSKRSALMVAAVLAVLAAMSLLVVAHYQGSQQAQLRQLHD